MASPLALVPVGTNPTLLWGMTNTERTRRIAASQGFAADDAGGPAILANTAFAFDPVWTAHLKTRPGTVVTRGGVPVLAHVRDASERLQVEEAMRADAAMPATALTVIAAEADEGILNEALRKREKPFAERLVPAAVPGIERASYVGAYKGVTDLLTKYLWPEWALAITRVCARFGITPNQVTALGSVLCIVATIAFWHGWFWTGLATGLVFMVLDTVDGKLARCTITASKLGNAWDHGVDLVHPPFWWWAWAAGCAPYGRPLDDTTFWWVIGTMLFGYVAQRLIEGAFIVRFGMHIHVWERFDSRFRLVTARRNPNMVILFACLLLTRPDWGIIGVAAWTAISLVVHMVRLLQAIARRARGEALTSWLA
ncbi:CDP-alcohol phosphatidyltransferase family protein [Sphingomonas ginsenosidivorax]|uniref:CDP-alcohol phosphatidyltransferase family protein n=1 Tax=Sphingomonas ginsenosidivorax TaxID=862135 RepID=A0A5C6UA70_9SPHN|nr:CDP-alcohol phosphatidyltransferase family protein [Sphingomonas ginsenosidivorax]TXC69719.1 CDP-alcohol phosphatidyltransferase family protein [Sphingomonas ginsenosidivorax]